jgi:hypothetical protein
VRAPAGSKLDPFREWVCEQLAEDPSIQAQRLRELAGELGYEGGKTIFDDYVREVRPRFRVRRTFQRTVYRPGELVQCDLWEPREPVPVGHGQTRRGWVVTAELCWSRVIAGALIFSKEAPDILWGVGRCLERIGALPEKLVWDRESAIGPGGRPSDEFAAFCGQLRVGWHFCEPADPQAKGIVERLQDFIERSFEPGRAFANELDFQLQLDAWFDERANTRTHKTLRARPIDRLIDEHQVMTALPASAPDTDRRWVLRVPADPFLRFDSCDYSLDPRLVGQRVEARVSDHEVLAVALDSGAIACRHPRSFAKHRTITALEHARTLKAGRGSQATSEPVVEIRPLAHYDALIA